MPLIVLALFALSPWPAAVATESSCPPLPGDTQALFEALDLTRPGLEAVSTAWGAGDAESACRLLVAYYMGASTATWLRAAPVPPGVALVGGQTDAAVFNDTYTFEIQPQCTVGGGGSGSKIEPVLGCAEEHFSQGGGWTPSAGETSRIPRIAASGNLDWMWEGGKKWQVLMLVLVLVLAPLTLLLPLTDADAATFFCDSGLGVLQLTQLPPHLRAAACGVQEYCELQHTITAKTFLEFSIENAEIMDNCP